jgi:hypothetical protein
MVASRRLEITSVVLQRLGKVCGSGQLDRQGYEHAGCVCDKKISIIGLSCRPDQARQSVAFQPWADLPPHGHFAFCILTRSPRGLA